MTILVARATIEISLRINRRSRDEMIMTFDYRPLKYTAKLTLPLRGWVITP